MEAKTHYDAFTQEDALCLLAQLRDARGPRREPTPNEVPTEVDVRVQYLPTNDVFLLHSGNACYDLDHCGYWGAGSVCADDTDEQLAGILVDLVDEAIENAACDLAGSDDYNTPFQTREQLAAVVRAAQGGE
jgi:hypothetical protein